MVKSNKEGLSKYVSHTLKEKELSVRDVQIMSGGKITAGYVSGIVNGTATNPSVEKLKALALGLGVDEEEVFLAARGLLEPGDAKNQSSSRSHSLIVLDMKKRVVAGPEVSEIMQEVMQLSQRDRTVLLETAKRLRRTAQKSHSEDKN